MRTHKSFSGFPTTKRQNNLGEIWSRKADWGGIQEADCYSFELPESQRRIAKRKFFKHLNARVKQMNTILGLRTARSRQSIVQAQLDPFFAVFPKHLTPQAAIGLTVYLAYREHICDSDANYNLFKNREPQISRSREDFQKYSFDLYLSVAVNVVHHRICMAELVLEQGISEVEACRLYCASQINLRFPSVTSILRNITLYGDLVHVDKDLLHPMSAAVYEDVLRINSYYTELMLAGDRSDYITLGAKWVEDIMESALWFLPLTEQVLDIKATEPRNNVYRFLDNSPPSSMLQGKALNAPQPPYLFNPNSSQERLARFFQKPMDLFQIIENISEDSILDRFLTAVELASRNSVKGLSCRSDLFEWNPMGLNRGNIQGDIQEGHLVRFKLPHQEQPVEGEISDSPLEPVDDPQLIEKLCLEAMPITEELRNRLYPGILGAPVEERLKTSGSLDPARLSNAGFSEAIFRRYALETKQDKNGSPVLAFLIDGSGSIGPAQTHMLKLLLTAWLESTMHLKITLLAGIYNAYNIHTSDTEARIKWICHPNKSISISKKDALASVAGIPDEGSGYQMDALSLLFMMEEAKKLAQGNNIYLVHMTDCEFGKSFSSDLNSEEEMHETYTALYNELQDKLNVLLLQVCGPENTLLDNLLNKVVRLSRDDLENVLNVARIISEQLAQSLNFNKNYQKAV